MNIGPYFLNQDISTAENIREYSNEEYTTAESMGIFRMLENEKTFSGPPVSFADIEWEYYTIGSTKDKIYKIAIQVSSNEKKTIKNSFEKVLSFLTTTFGRYTEHNFLSNKYFWDLKDQNVMLDRLYKFNVYFINVFFTSSIISEQSDRIREYLSRK